MYRIKKMLAMATLLAFSMLLMFGSFPNHVNAAHAAQTEFIKGMDLSSLEAIEDAGGIFYDENNNQITNILAYVKSKGVNYVRLRVWNNPTLGTTAIRSTQLKWHRESKQKG